MFLLQDTGLHYDRYLREVIDFLEKDPHFKEKLQNTSMEEIKVRVPADSSARRFVGTLTQRLYSLLAAWQTFQRAGLCPPQSTDQAGRAEERGDEQAANAHQSQT